MTPEVYNQRLNRQVIRPNGHPEVTMSGPARRLARRSVLVAVIGLVSGPGLYGRQTPIPDRQQTPDPPATGLIVGQVVDATTGRPVPGAIVSLTASTAALAAAGLVAPGELQMTATGPAVPTRMIANAEGRFVLRNLAKGRYSFSATANGYLLGQHGQGRAGGPGYPLELEEGGKVLDATIRLWKAATITGTVLDEANEPVVGVGVRTLRRAFSGGRLRWLQQMTAQTDDRGFYRIAGLSPGDYAVAVLASMSTLPTATADAYMETIMSGQSGLTSPLYRDLISSGAPSPGISNGIRIDDFVVQPSSTLGRTLLPPAPGDDGKMLAYQTVYHPAATSVAQLTVITLGSGDEKTGVDLHLRLVPTFRVSGTLIGPEGPVANMGVRLLPATADEFSSELGLEVVNTATDAQGAFTFFGVPPGAYTLKVLKMPRPLPTPMSEGMVMVSSGAGGVAFGTSIGGTPPPPPPLPTDPTFWATLPVTVTEANLSGLTVSLRPGFRVTGRVEFEGTRDRPTPEQIQRMAVTLLPIDSRLSGIVTPGRISSDGQFRTLGFPPGKYLVNFAPGAAGVDWTLKAATFGGRDISDEPLEIAGSDIDGVVLVLTDRPSQLSGTVRNAQGQGDAQADVVIFPADHQLWKQYGVTPRRARSIRAARTGAYSTQGLPAGDYYVVAVESTSTRDWQDPKFLEAAARVATRVTIVEGDKKALDLKTTRIR
jgi:protocatechuate 3,4-dioxygenase beta subunit